MSLQGTLDTFPLPDVLRLLAATRKSGLLRVEVTRGTGRVWFAGGELAAVAPPAEGDGAAPSAPTADLLFELLRCREGAFAFAAGDASPVDGEPTALEPVLQAADALVEEWRTIEAVVPSLRSTVRLCPDLGAPERTVTAAQWHLVVAVGGGTTVGRLGAAEGMGELAVSRAVKGLVEAGLVAVGAPAEDDVPAPAPGPAPAAEAAAEDDVPAEQSQAEEHAEAASPAPSARDEVGIPPATSPAPAPATVSVGGFTRRPPGGRPATGRPAGPSPLGASLAKLSGADRRPAAPASATPPEQAEVARTLAELGPEAEAAVAAAAGAATPEERDAALDAIAMGPNGEGVNRGALLKFLSSVRS